MKTHHYFNFDGQAEEAFNFYRSVFGGEFTASMKMTSAPDSDKLPEEERDRIMHISLPLGEGTILMGSDILPSAGHKLQTGNNMYIMLSPDSREEAKRLFDRLSEGGEIEMPLEDQFWGDYFGSFIDKFGIRWMVDVESVVVS